MCLPSELVDGFEPHAKIYSVRHVRQCGDSGYSGQCGAGGVPGVVQEVGYWEGAIPGTNQGSILRPV